jgi:hypothetical protein
MTILMASPKPSKNLGAASLRSWSEIHKSVATLTSLSITTTPASSFAEKFVGNDLHLVVVSVLAGGRGSSWTCVDIFDFEGAAIFSGISYPF